MSQPTAQPTRLGPLGLLCLFTLLFSICIGITSPLVPLFARSLGASYTQIGLLGAGVGVAHLCFALLVGTLSDRFGRRAILIAAGFLVAAVSAGYLFATVIHQLLSLRLIEGLSIVAFVTATEALATELSGARSVGATMGWVSAALNAGFAGGSVIGGSVTDHFGFSSAFGVCLLVATTALVVALALRDTTTRHSGPTGIYAQIAAARFVWRNNHALLGFISGAIYIFHFGVLVTFLPVYARASGLSISSAGLLLALLWLTRMLASLGAGPLSDRIGRYPVLASALLACAVGFALVALGKGALLFPAVAVVGFGLGATFPVGIALVAENVPSAQRGLAMGMFETGGGFATIAATAGGGLLADHLNPLAPYVVASVLSIAVAFRLAAVSRQRVSRSADD